MGAHDVDALNAGFAGQLLEQYLESPDSVPAEWRALFESGEVLPGLPGLARLLERAGTGNGQAETAPALLPAAAPTTADAELLGGVAAATALVRAYRTHGHLAARLDPLGSEPPGDPALEPELLIPPLTPELQARIPAGVLRTYVEGETRAAAAAGDVLRHDRIRARAHLRPRGTRLAAGGDRIRSLPRAARRRREAAPADAADGGRGTRDLPAQGVPRPEAVLDRRSRRARADARRGDRARGGRRRARGADRDGAPRPAQRARARDRAAVRGDPA